MFSSMGRHHHRQLQPVTVDAGPIIDKLIQLTLSGELEWQRHHCYLPGRSATSDTLQAVHQGKTLRIERWTPTNKVFVYDSDNKHVPMHVSVRLRKRLNRIVKRHMKGKIVSNDQRSILESLAQ